MKNTIQYLIIIFLISSFVSCTNDSNNNTTNDQSPITKADWLIGSWVFQMAEGSITEAWTKKTDTEFSGVSYFVAGKDTLPSETISLKQEKNRLVYSPTVLNQNNQETIRFEQTSLDDHQLIFENPMHDFPQKIVYTKITNDSMWIEVSGNINGENQSQKFPMIKKE